jgi:very-short-patch-repair endonuclease
MHPVDLLRAYGGHARAVDLLARTTRRRLEAALATGEVIRAGRGVYVLPALPSPHAAAAKAGGVLSYESGADQWGLSLLTSPTAIHVTVPHGARPLAQPNVVLHWSTSPLPRWARVTPVLRTVLDCATTLPFARALGVADSALAQGRLTPSQLLEAAVTSPARGRSVRLRVARAADGRAANAFESCLRATVLEAGVQGFQPQLVIDLGSRVVRVDLGDPARRIVLEADSYAHHGSREALVRDCERYDELIREGWRVLRFSWEHVVFRPEWVADTVTRTCRRSSRGR